ncbi:MAG: aldehyde ferredoxin oxidoreductase C-terminal domain-containing protein [Methanosarcinales archaeon]
MWNLERRYNNREGLARPENTLPKRLLETSMPEGPAKGQFNSYKVSSKNLLAVYSFQAESSFVQCGIWYYLWLLHLLQ